jgi:hypothetical protein
MYDSELPAAFETGEGMTPYLDVHRIFARTEYGKRLAGRIRFAPYKPASISAADWERALGSDVNALAHLRESYRELRQFLGVMLYAGSQYSDRDLESLQLAALIHDWQESLEHIGDIIDTLKADDGHAREMDALRSLIPEVAPDASLARRLEEALDAVLLDRESALGSLFRAQEILGSMKVGLKAWKKASAVKGTHQSHFRYLAVHVFSYQMPKLLALAGHYVPIAAFLRKHEQAFGDMAGLPPDEFGFFPPEGIDREASHYRGLREQFEKASELWDGRMLPEVPPMGEFDD